MKKIAVLILLLCISLSCVQRVEEEYLGAIPEEPSYQDGDGDYNGDGVIDDGKFMRFSDEYEEGVPSHYEIIFHNSDMPNLPMGCCDGTTISEGDLDGDGIAEVTVLQAPENGCNFWMSTYTFKKGQWRRIIAPFLFPSDCKDVSGDMLKSLIVKEGDDIFIMETDFNDKGLKRHKKQVTLL